MKDNYNNFVRWFEEPLSNLYKNPHAGFAIIILSLPILERYLREKSGVCEQPNLDDRFHQEFLNMFPSVKDMPTSRKFWEVYRHGLLHQATLKAHGTVLSAAVHGAAAELEFDGKVFTVAPVKFSQRVVNTIELDFTTYEGAGSPKHSLSKVSVSTGRSGYNPDMK
jgi:hypothetical protein